MYGRRQLLALASGPAAGQPAACVHELFEPRLVAAGVREEFRVGVLLRRGPGLVTAPLAVLKAGAAYLPLDPAHPARRLADMLGEADTRVVLTETALTGRLDSTTVDRVLVDPDEFGAVLSAENLGPTAATLERERFGLLKLTPSHLVMLTGRGRRGPPA